MKLGLLGGGQLARMMALAGAPLGIRSVIVDPKADACAAPLGEFFAADYEDSQALKHLAECDRVTCDFENVPAAALAALESRTKVHPSPSALAIAQDRKDEKHCFEELGIETVAFRLVSSRPELAAAVEELGYPVVLKTRRLGYDGKGQAVLRDPEDLELAWRELGESALIAEQWIDFDFECAITAVRGESGEMRFWPVSRTWHRDGILQMAGSLPVPEWLQARAETTLRSLAEHLHYVGCMTLELFVAGDRLLANEFAPRVHNSAHWTIEGSSCSQFENHLRAVAGWPLGETRARGVAMMFNFIGQLPDRSAWLQRPGLHWHDYCKAERPGRKVGHATLVASTPDALKAQLEAARSALSLPDEVDEVLGILGAN